ncbi:MAG: hypothetical protein COB94_010500 [Gammaproteobacteria bacterium]|nr:hypothetical protein [Gammaproteobacteria bacterium]
MHPLIRIVCLVLMAGFIAHAQLSFLLISLCLLSAIYVLASLSLDRCWSLVQRMRWFFLSILVIYFWFTPGEAFSPELAKSLWFPSVDGVEQGVIRVACLILIIAAVSALLQSTTREQLFSAIYSLIGWTRHVGLSPERFAVRATLTLESLTEIQSMISTSKAQLSSPPGIKARIVGLANATSNVFVAVYNNAQQSELTSVTLDDAEPLRAWQWLYPLSLIALFAAALKLTSVVS